MADKPNPKTEFGTPQQVENCVITMQNIEDMRAADRAKINNLFNGGLPYTADEEEKFQIRINVNWGYGKNVMRDAISQLNNALLHPGTLFYCSLERGRVDKRDEWSQAFTNNIHTPLQRGFSGKKYYYAMRNRNATIAMHGIGALLWPNDFRWMPRYVALEDLLIPTGTYCDFTNLRYFAVNFYLTPAELVELTQGDKIANGWNKGMVADILDSQIGQYSEGWPSTWRNQPEAMWQVFKENQGFYASDIVPKIKLRGFYWQQVDKPNKWFRHIILREAYGDVKVGGKFLFDGGDKPFADNISQVLSVQYGDNNYVAPQKYHAVRGIGVDLYSPIETLNRLQCETVQHTLEQLKMYFRIADPADRDRLKQVVLSAYGVIPEGLNIVPQTDRHQIKPELVSMSMSLIRQNMQESSASYVSNPDNGTEKEMTAREANIKLNQANQMVGGMMTALYMQETPFYEEVVRRFLNPNSEDSEVKDFRKACIRDGIPEELLKPEYWRVVPERVLGGGDKTQAQTEAQWLLQNRTIFDPSSQPKILRIATGTMLNNFAKAKELVPDAPVEATDGVMAAENVFATLMRGQPCVLRQGIDQIGYIETLLKMMGNTINQIQQTSNVGTMDELVGLMVVSQNIQKHVMILAGDDAEKQRVKQYGDDLGQLMNEVKGFYQRLSEQQQKSMEQQGQDPKAVAAAQNSTMLAQVKAQIATANAQLKQKHKDLAFQMDQERENLRLMHQLKREDLLHHQTVVNDGLEKTLSLAQDIKALNTKNNSGQSD